MDKKETLKGLIASVKREIKNEPRKSRKQRLNKYKQKLEIELREYTFLKNGGKYESI